MTIFLLGAAGTGTELLLIGHIEEVWQWVPLLLLLTSFVMLFAHAVASVSIRIFQGIMILFITSGIIGIGIHYNARMEFKLEMNPALKGKQLILETIRGATVPPVLAPGIMIQLGLLGLACTYRHPTLPSTENNKTTTKEL
ncbi:hypothetical protein L0222_12945 [bacterium]|nr:hypothetical protein [bacterium]MCI0605707.1 hypothetical protein [bacterium]